MPGRHVPDWPTLLQVEEENGHGHATKSSERVHQQAHQVLGSIQMSLFLSGALTICFWGAGLFFLGYRHHTGDRLLLTFVLAFAVIVGAIIARNCLGRA